MKMNFSYTKSARIPKLSWFAKVSCNSPVVEVEGGGGLSVLTNSLLPEFGMANSLSGDLRRQVLRAVQVRTW